MELIILFIFHSAGSVVINFQISLDGVPAFLADLLQGLSFNMADVPDIEETVGNAVNDTITDGLSDLGAAVDVNDGESAFSGLSGSQDRVHLFGGNTQWWNEVKV